ncbi:hypothetical protein LDENG_00163900 [Lucifuga dentata]|nr:hypothetical protein LDENG_00163900 [Lucifuga dentata]
MLSSDGCEEQLRPAEREDCSPEPCLPHIGQSAQLQMRTAETNTSTATWWFRLASACTITTKPRAVLPVPEWPTDSQFIGAAASILYWGPLVLVGARLRTRCRNS